MRQFKTIFLSAFAVFIFACSSEDDPIKEDDPMIMTSLDLKDMEVGDSYEYSLFLGESYIDPTNDNFRYTNDFLHVEITEEITNGFIVKEYLDPNSDIFTNNENYYYNIDSVFYNKWIIENDSFKIEPINKNYVESHLFLDASYLGALSLAKNEAKEVMVSGWKTDAGFSERNEELYAEDVTILNNTYEYLNVAVHNEPMAFDGNGNTYLYSKDDGFVRVVTYSAWTSEGIGWDRK